jgi:hypothetical protein
MFPARRPRAISGTPQRNAIDIDGDFRSGALGRVSIEKPGAAAFVTMDNYHLMIAACGTKKI